VRIRWGFLLLQPTVTCEAQVFVAEEQSPDPDPDASQADTSPTEPIDTDISKRRPCCSPSKAIDVIVDFVKRRPVLFAIVLIIAALGASFLATFLVVLLTDTSDSTTAPTSASTTAPASDITPR
jgi:hypothetical protein